MQFSASQIAAMLNGKLEGDPDVQVDDIAKIEEAEKNTICFIANPKYEEYIYSTKAGIVIINEDFDINKTVQPTLIRVKDAYGSFAKLLEQYNEIINQDRINKKGIEKPAYIADSANLGKDVYIGAFAYLGKNVTIGDNTKIYPGVYLGDNVTVGSNTTLYAGVKVYFDCEIGHQVILHSGVVIGSDGFGFAPDKEGKYNKIPQIGNVCIENNVEIGANTCIDRATMGSTIISEGVKLDNLIQIAHNVEIDKNTVIAAQTGISGSTKIGKNCTFGGQVGIVGHIKIADQTRVGAQSGILRSNTESNKALNGTPAMGYTQSLRSYSIYKNLPKLEKRVKELEGIINQLQEEKK